MVTYILGNGERSFTRWGIYQEPVWVHGATVVAPAGNTALVTRTVTAGKTLGILGWIISAGEANDFNLTITSGGVTTTYLIAGQASTVVVILPSALISGLPVGSVITINNITAGGAGILYRADLLYDEQ